MGGAGPRSGVGAFRLKTLRLGNFFQRPRDSFNTKKNKTISWQRK